MRMTVVKAPKKGIFKSHPSERLDGAVQECVLHLFWYFLHMGHAVQNAGYCFSGGLENKPKDSCRRYSWLACE